MLRVEWKKAALNDRDRIARHIAEGGGPQAARKLDAEFVEKARTATQRPKLYRAGRMLGTHEIVVRPNYVMVYRVAGDAVVILRVLHARQQSPDSNS
jgi:toxin ParE1/3/4